MQQRALAGLRRRLPEVAAYPPTIPVTPIVTLQYTIHAGQVYLGVASSPGNNYYAPLQTFEGCPNHRRLPTPCGSTGPTTSSSDPE